ncbi:MAG: hypothetical protein K6T83_17790, partial [Alicyclobacillus sp.]|nr:hypothetical protein [Alicyclobacillus sp.]
FAQANGERMPDTGEQYVPASDGLQGLVQRAGSSDAGLVVIVSGTGIEPSELAMATKKLGTRFELVQPNTLVNPGINVREVVADATLSAYSIGWLAGQLAASEGKSQVGWVGGRGSVSTNAVKTALGALYHALPQATLTPLFSPAVQPGTVQPATPPATALSTPSVVIAARPLTPIEADLIRQAGGIVLSLCTQPNDPYVVAQPAMPNMDSLLADLRAYRDLTWKAGVASVRAAPFVEVNSAALAAPMLSSLADVQRTLQANPGLADTAWLTMPSNVQMTWLQFVQ